MTIATAYLIFVAVVSTFAMYNTWDRFNIFINTRFLGKQKIYVYNGQHEFNESFFTYINEPKKIVEDEEIKLTANRYPATGSGRVSLYDDNKAYYCGSYKWTKM